MDDISIIITLILFILLGTVSLIAAITNAEWYFGTDGVQFFIRWLGRKKTRIFYAVLGSLLIATGICGIIYY